MMEKLMTFNSDNTEDNPGIQWGKPESRPAYGHSQTRHGAKRPARELIDRARGIDEPQGQFYDDAVIVEAEKRTRGKPAFGPQNNCQIAEFGEPIGRVYQPDGSITKNVTKVLVIRRRDGTARSSYPITDEYALSLLVQEGRN